MIRSRCDDKLGLFFVVLQQGSKLKKLLWLVIALGPVLAAAQGLSPTLHAPIPKSAAVTSNPGGKLEVTLEQLRDRLALSPQQAGPWNAYADKVNAYADVFYREKPVLASQESTAVHQVGRLVDNMQNRLAALEEVESAAKTLYASLSPEQQRVANQLLFATIPSFNFSGKDAPDNVRAKGPKPESAAHQRRGGSMGGG